jgi:hypothetical protein
VVESEEEEDQFHTLHNVRSITSAMDDEEFHTLKVLVVGATLGGLP